MCSSGGNTSATGSSAHPPASPLLRRLRACERPRRDRRTVIEEQVALLLEAADVTTAPVPASLLGLLPEIYVRRWPDLSVSGIAARDARGWVILINSSETEQRQRFTLLHELGHVIADMSADDPADQPWKQQERDCNYFAACVLMPEAWVRADWERGLRDEQQLARRYGVHRRGVQRRLVELGLAKTSDYRSKGAKT